MSAVQKDGSYAWFYSAITALVCFLFIGLVDSIGITVAVFIVHYNESNAKGGWVGSIVTFLIFALAPVVVYIYNRFGFRWCMFIASVFYCLSLIITPFVPNMNFVFLTYAIPTGISISFISTLSIVTQREHFSKYFGFAIGVRYSASALGSVVMSFILPLAFNGMGFKNTLLSLIAFLPFILCYGLVSRHQVTDVDIRSYKYQKSTKNIYWEFLQDRTFTLSLVGVALYLLCSTIPFIFMVRYGMTLGYPLSKAKWFLVVKGITTLVGTLLIGRINDKLLKHGKVKMISVAVCVIFGVLSFLCSFVKSFPMIMVFMALIGLVDGAWWAAYPVLVVEITSGYHSTEAFGLTNFVGALARLPGPPFLGWLFDITGDFRYVFYVMFVISMIAAVLSAMSSYVSVEKHLSLMEKSNLRKTHIESSEAGEDVSCCFFDNLVIEGALLYETSV